MDTYFFDLDRTLYAYKLRNRLSELARLSGASQYRIASDRWAGGSKHPAPLGETPPLLAPDVCEIVGGNILVSYLLGVRKPDPDVFSGALASVGTMADKAFFADDSLDNVEGAGSVCISAYHLEYAGDVPQTDTLLPAIEAFARRER